MKILSSFFLPIPLNGKRGRNRGALSEKASSKAAFLIVLLHNSSKDALLFFLLHPLIILSSFHLFATKSGVGVFGKDNAEKDRGVDPGSIGIDRRTRADNLGTGIDVDAGADNPGIAADDSGKATDDPGTKADDSGIAANNPSIAADDPGTGTDVDVGVDNPSIVANDLGTGTDADVGADNASTATSNKALVCTASLFALRHALFLLVSSFELVTASFPSYSPSSSLTTLWSKPVLSCSVTSVKRGAPSSRYPVDEMWRPSLSKVLSGMSAMVRFL